MITVWIDIAIKMSVATIATTWGVFLKRRLENPKTSSAQIDPSNRGQKSWWGKRFAKRVLTSRWVFPMLCIVFGLLNGRDDYQRTTIVTKPFVIEMIRDAATIAIGFVSFILAPLLQDISN